MTAEFIRQTINLLLEAQKPTRDSLIKRQIQQMLRQAGVTNLDLGPHLVEANWYQDILQLHLNFHNTDIGYGLFISLGSKNSRQEAAIYSLEGEWDDDDNLPTTWDGVYDLTFYQPDTPQDFERRKNRKNLMDQIVGKDIGIAAVLELSATVFTYHDDARCSFIRIAPNSPLDTLIAAIPNLDSLPSMNLLTGQPLD